MIDARAANMLIGMPNDRIAQASLRLMQMISQTGYVSFTRSCFRDATGVAANHVNISRMISQLAAVGLCVDRVSDDSHPNIAFAVGKVFSIPECPQAYLAPCVASNDPRRRMAANLADADHAHVPKSTDTL